MVKIQIFTKLKDFKSLFNSHSGAYNFILFCAAYSFSFSPTRLPQFLGAVNLKSWKMIHLLFYNHQILQAAMLLPVVQKVYLVQV